MFKFDFSRVRIVIPMLASLLLVAACGGGGTTVASVGSGGTGIVSGAVTKGPVGSSTVTAYGVSGGLMMSTQIGTATTDASGNFSMAIGAYTGPVVLQASGGSYTDEATGVTMAVAAGDVMTAIMPTVAAGVNTTGIQVTPVTAMAQALAQNKTGGMTEANIASANAAMGNYFSVSDILHVQPMNPLVTGSGTGASPDARNYGVTLAAMSQYANTLKMSASSALVTAMMDDASDGMMDGKKGGSQISMGGMMGNSMMASTAGWSSLATAMLGFINSTANVSHVTATDMVELMQKLNSSNGKI